MRQLQDNTGLIPVRRVVRRVVQQVVPTVVQQVVPMAAHQDVVLAAHQVAKVGNWTCL